MDWREALRARAIGLAEGRVYWTERPQSDPLPALVMTAVADERPQHFKDFSLAAGRVQFDAYATTPKGAWDLTEATIAQLINGESSNGHNFGRADVSLGPRDLTDRAGNETIFRVSMDLTIHHAPSEEGS